MRLRKRVNALELNADAASGLFDHLEGNLEENAEKTEFLYDEHFKALSVNRDIYANLGAALARIEALEKKLAELEPELEQYRQAVEEAERQERLRNDGMAAIFGYEPVTMRGGGDGNE